MKKFCKKCGTKLEDVECKYYNEETGEKVHDLVCPNYTCECHCEFWGHIWKRKTWWNTDVECKFCGFVPYDF